MNRLRHDDMLALFESAGHRVLSESPAVRPRALEQFTSGALRIAPRFAPKSPEILATLAAWIVSEKATA